MTIKVACQCGKRFAAPPRLAGMSVNCPSCGAPIQIAAPPAAAPRPAPAAPAAAQDGIAVGCGCGKKFRAPPQLAGRQVSCPVCQQPIMIPAPAATGLDLALPDPFAVSDDLWKDMPQQPAWPPPQQQTAWSPPQYAAAPMPEFQAAHNSSLANPYLASAYAQDVEQKSETNHWGTGQILSGILMMLIACIWFCTGLMFDIIFFYPPVLFIFGGIAFINGIIQKVNR